MKISVFWFRRDLRLIDNTALNAALHSGRPVLPLFIFDTNILKELDIDDARISFIHESLRAIHNKLVTKGSSLLCLTGDPVKAWTTITGKFDVS
ncbi:MAG: deoxyribodipyrimidine photo-lyase, partial [Bacteroidales bacterium]